MIKAEKTNEKPGADPSGFSLMELLIVVVIIGIMLMVAVPSIDFGRYRVESSMQSLGSILLASQQAAVTGQHDVIVVFDTNKELIRVHRDLDSDGVEDPGEIARNYPNGEHVVFGLGGAPGMTGWSGTKITFTRIVGGLPRLIFHRSGTASENGGFYLTSANPSTAAARFSTRAIQIDRATGRTSWYRYVSAGWERGF